MACLSLMGCFSACNDDKEGGNEGDLSFKFPLKEYQAPKIGETKMVGFSTVDKWTAEVAYTVEPTKAAEAWLEVSPMSGGAGHHFLSIKFGENAEFDDREATITITSGGQTKTMTVSQLATGALFVPQGLYEVGEKGKVLDITVETNREFEVIVADEAADWIHPVDASKLSVMETKIAQVLVDPTPLMDQRSGFVYIKEKNDDPKAEIISRRVEIIQKGDIGYFIMRGVFPDLTAPSLVKNGDGSFSAFYTYKTKNTAGKDIPLWAGDAQGPHDLALNGDLGIRFVAGSVFNKMSLSGCTWGQQDGDGRFTFSIFAWDTDYATTIAGTPIYKQVITYPDNSWPNIMPDNSSYPAGEYLLLLQSPKVATGVWCSTNPLPEGIESYVNGQKTTSKMAKIRLCYEADQSTGAAYRSSKDGITWSNQGYVYGLNYSWMKKSSPSDLRIAKCGNFVYALIADAGNVKIARGDDAVDNTWETWKDNWVATNEYASVWNGVKPVSLVENAGSIYLYAMDGAKLMVKKAASSGNWPASLGAASTAFTFPAATDVDVKYHAATNQFVATYIKENKTYELVSTDGVTFTDGGVSIARMFNGAKAVRFIAGDAAMGYLSYVCDQGWYFKIMESAQK